MNDHLCVCVMCRPCCQLLVLLTRSCYGWLAITWSQVHHIDQWHTVTDVFIYFWNGRV